eukprot:c18513_g1_i2 orf=112-870(+)
MEFVCFHDLSHTPFLPSSSQAARARARARWTCPQMELPHAKATNMLSLSPKWSFSNRMATFTSRYNSALRDNVYEKRAASIAEQLCGQEMVFDYDQLLAKPPNRTDGIFSWHQDLAYWPITKDTRTASFWLAIDNSRIENGCLNFVPGSHLEPSLRYHGPLHGDRDKSHTLATVLLEKDVFKAVEIDRGDVTVHHERIIHGSGRNFSSTDWRRAWVIAFRSQETVEQERQLGFTHSHNDALDVLNQVGKEKC